mgnify:CR=1 FL=1
MIKRALNGIPVLILLSPVKAGANNLKRKFKKEEKMKCGPWILLYIGYVALCGLIGYLLGKWRKTDVFAIGDDAPPEFGWMIWGLLFGIMSGFFILMDIALRRLK